MALSSRHEDIIALLAASGEVTVEDLADRLGVSRETVRRDLARLESNGHLRRYHGGARSLATGPEPETEWPFAQRMAQNAAGKKRIALAARELFGPDESLFIDTGSTTIAFAEALVMRPSLMAITNSPRIAATLAANHSHKVFLLGGAYGADAGESLGPLALEQIGKFRARHAVLTIGAIDAHAVMDFDLQEAEVAKAMIERADRVTVLADHSKFERGAVFELAPLARIHRLVTDLPPSEAMTRALVEAGVELIVADRD
ncbi:DeoR/GlpR family DNA-binding transcription regulator [Ancylobacter vacuolatus]|uniref:DeoR family glycerol-3-phosphate regulon repressor n=1 Tax=Ancylobacter vacuolatus TaxID=223389 RepID=A0ABU0DKM1_9HYPH|nr:DeoR/GlpR family DNA-binding transcription regulator [Ancylobacter vacuolatus]MDQ0348982.1 DeoR family glycerol-3-phosphate regulon repressor [Ancylobacter vacuolatus]